MSMGKVISLLKRENYGIIAVTKSSFFDEFLFIVNTPLINNVKLRKKMKESFRIERDKKTYIVKDIRKIIVDILNGDEKMYLLMSSPVINAENNLTLDDILYYLAQLLDHEKILNETLNEENIGKTEYEIYAYLYYLLLENKDFNEFTVKSLEHIYQILKKDVDNVYEVLIDRHEEILNIIEGVNRNVALEELERLLIRTKLTLII